MRDDKLIAFVTNNEHIPAMVCSQFRTNPHYEDMVSAARCGMIAAARKYTGDRDFGGLAVCVAKRAAYRYLNRLSRTVRAPSKVESDARPSDRALSLDFEYANGDGDNVSLLDSLVDQGISPARKAEIADDINRSIACINEVMRRQAMGSHRRRTKSRGRL